MKTKRLFTIILVMVLMCAITACGTVEITTPDGVVAVDETKFAEGDVDLKNPTVTNTPVADTSVEDDTVQLNNEEANEMYEEKKGLGEDYLLTIHGKDYYVSDATSYNELSGLKLYRLPSNDEENVLYLCVTCDNVDRVDEVTGGWDWKMSDLYAGISDEYEKDKYLYYNCNMKFSETWAYHETLFCDAFTYVEDFTIGEKLDSDVYYTSFAPCRRMSSLREVHHLERLSDIEIKQTQQAFEKCNLTELDFGDVAFTKLHSLRSVAYECPSLKTFKINFTGNSSIKLDGAFSYNTQLEMIVIKGLTSDNVMSARSPFTECVNLRYVDFDTLNLHDLVGKLDTKVRNMFGYCENLSELIADFTGITEDDWTYLGLDATQVPKPEFN